MGALEDRGDAPNPRIQRSGEAGRALRGREPSGSRDLMERVVARRNAMEALKRVRRNGTRGGRSVAPLSPLVSNVLLDEVDKTLEKPGHCFVPYADDCNVGVRSKRAEERVLTALRSAYAKLRLRAIEGESAVARVWGR